MITAGSLVSSMLQASKEFLGAAKVIHNQWRGATKKAASSTSYGGKRRPKRRGIKYNEGRHVTKGTILVKQNRLNYHPGLHVGFGRDGTLFAMENGTVLVTCENADVNWDHTWIQRIYNNRFNQHFYKKYFHIIPDAQHNRFKLIDMV